MKVVNKYEASDGQIFDTEQECRQHEAENEVTIEFVFAKMISDKRPVMTFDTWGTVDDGVAYRKLKELYAKRGKISYKEYVFNLTLLPSGGAGMGAYPETIKVCILHKFNEINDQQC